MRKHVRTRTRGKTRVKGLEQKQDLSGKYCNQAGGSSETGLSRAGGVTNSKCGGQFSRPAAKFEREDKKKFRVTVS